MNRQAFKQRMQNLKSYRDSNPGKGYWEWKVEEFADGGEVEKTEFHENWYKARLDKLGKNEKEAGTGLINLLRSDKSVGKDAYERIIGNIKSIPEVTRQTINSQQTQDIVDYINRVVSSEEPIGKEKALEYNRILNAAITVNRKSPNQNDKFILYNRDTPSLRTHERTHAGNAYSQEALIKRRNIKGIHKYNGSYYDDPSEIYSRLMEVRHANHLNPMEVITDEKIEQLRNTGEDFNLLNNYNNEDLKFLFNDIAEHTTQQINRPQYLSNGGTTGDPEKEQFYQATGRSRSGRPLEQGLKPIFDLEDAASMTPIGDVMSARDTYNAVREKDWLGAGLAAVGVLPFVPGALRKAKGNVIKHTIPDMGKPSGKALQDMIDAAQVNSARRMDYLSDVGNAKNRILEDVNSIPYRNRAAMADAQFNTNYNDTYDLLNDMYEQNFFALPEVQPGRLGKSSGRMQAKPHAETRFERTGMGAGPEDFDFKVDTDKYLDPMQMATHEMNHYTDYLISRNPNTTVNNPMLKSLEKSLKKADANSTDYFRMGTEQKSYMNQLRRELKQKGIISDLDERVLPSTLENYIDKLSDSNSIKKAFKEHNSSKNYAKWFNSIPLLGVGAIGANQYFTKEKQNNNNLIK